MNAEFYDVFVHGRMKIIHQLSKGNERSSKNSHLHQS